MLAFFGMLRLSSLFPPVEDQLLISSVAVHSWGIVLHFTYSKTVQCHERQPYVSLPWNTASPCLCPGRALLTAWKMSQSVVSSDPLLAYRVDGVLVTLSRSVFSTHLHRILLLVGLKGYSGHSFQRGGATHALKCGMPAEMIKAQGDWKSMAYLNYLDLDACVTRAAFIKSMY